MKPAQITVVSCILLMWVSASAGPTSQPAIVVFPIIDARHPLMIPVNVDGKAACLIFDTGCSTSFMDSAAFPGLRAVAKNWNGDSSGGPISGQLFEPPRLSIGPWNLADAGLVARADLSPFGAIMDLPVVGLLGVNVWRGWVVQMDFDAHELRFFRPDDHPHPEWGTSIPMEGDYADGNDIRLPKIRLTVGDFEGLFVIDSGADLSDLPQDYAFDRVLSATTHPAIIVPVTSMAGLSTHRILRAADFQISDLHYKNLLLGETKDWTGALGLEFLSRHLVTMDWPNHRLYLKPGKEFDRYDEYDMSGLTLERLNSKTIVYSALPDRPGYQAGLRVGDELLEINGKSASKYDLYDLTDLLRSKDGLKITVKFRRDKVVQTASFSLRKEI